MQHRSSPPVLSDFPSSPGTSTRIRYFANGGLSNRKIEIVSYHDADGRLHRTDGPALYQYGSDGHLASITYLRHGIPHNDSGFSEERYYPSGVLSLRRYLVNGLIHRVDGPAITHFLADGFVHKEGWYMHGVPHRVGGPAITVYGGEGGVITQEWYENGNIHCEDGPARIKFGKPEYFYEGIKSEIHNTASWIRYVKTRKIQEVMDS